MVNEENQLTTQTQTTNKSHNSLEIFDRKARNIINSLD